LIDTTPRDQLNLLKSILLPNSYLDTASQAYEQDLMENVVDYERFGIPTGVPTNATVGVKNGWYLEKATGCRSTRRATCTSEGRTTSRLS